MNNIHPDNITYTNSSSSIIMLFFILLNINITHLVFVHHFGYVWHRHCHDMMKIGMMVDRRVIVIQN